MHSLEEIIRGICLELERLGYKPVVVGTYALIIQGWLPPSYINETKDVDVYVDEPMVVFDDRVEERMIALGLSVGRSESGGFYIDVGKPIEVVYPIHDIFIPRALLRHVITVKGLKVLEGHATLVAKALGSPIEHLAHSIKSMGVKVDVQRLLSLLRGIVDEVEPSNYIAARRRIDAFIRKMFQIEERGDV